MDIVQAFIKDQFNDDDDIFGFGDGSTRDESIDNKPRPRQKSGRSKNGGGGPREGREVQNLKKELEELKFYQELERTEYEEMKKKMYDMERKNARTPKKTNDRPSIESNDIFDSLSDTEADSRRAPPKTPHLHRDLIKKDNEIAELKAQLQTYASASRFVDKGVDPKEFGKRMAKLEKAKNGEIEEIKKHYKSLMEGLAKQITKSNERYDDEIAKNDQMRSNMESMRNDMAAREQTLEDKLIQMEAIVKKAELKASKMSSKLEKSDKNLTNMEAKFKAAAKDREDKIMKLKFLEADFEEERKEMAEQFVKDQEDSHIMKDKMMHDLEVKVTEVKEKLHATEGKLDVEERSHENTVMELRKVQVELEKTRQTSKELNEKLLKAELEIERHQKESQEQIQKIEDNSKRRIGETNEMLNQMTDTRMILAEDLKTAEAKLFAAEKKMELMEENNTQKAGALRRKTYEMEQLQLELRELCDRHMKDLKSRDLQAVRDLKKWNAEKQVLKNQLEDIKMSAAYQKAQSSAIPNTIPENVSKDVLKGMVDQLRAEKASMKLQMNALRDRNIREIQILEKKLLDAKRAAANTTSKQDEPKKNVRRTISFSSSRALDVVADDTPEKEAENPATSESTTQKPASIFRQPKPLSSNPADDSSTSDVSATQSTTGAGKTLATSPYYRRSLRARSARRRPLKRGASTVVQEE